MLILLLAICITPTFAQGVSGPHDNGSSNSEFVALIQDLNGTLNNSNDSDAVALALIPYLKDDDQQVRLLAISDIIITKTKRLEVSQAETDLLNIEPAGQFRDLLELGLQTSRGTDGISCPSGQTNCTSITVVNKSNNNPEKNVPICSWSGAWSTNWGDMFLHQSGYEVSGNYTHKQGKIVGAVSGNKLIGTWSQAPSYSSRQDAGDVELTLSDDCKSFNGNWRYGSEGGWSGDWTGTRA